jgi:hypothetical protein
VDRTIIDDRNGAEEVRNLADRKNKIANKGREEIEKEQRAREWGGSELPWYILSSLAMAFSCLLFPFRVDWYTASCSDTWEERRGEEKRGWKTKRLEGIRRGKEVLNVTTKKWCSSKKERRQEISKKG